jgi:hypothetical protein
MASRTCTNSRTTSRARVRVGVVTSLAVASVVALTGCAPDGAKPAASTTPTPAPTVSAPSFIGPAPETEAAAIASATAALDEFIRIENQIFSEGGAEPERIDAISVPPASSEVHSSAEAIASRSMSVTGGIVATVLSAYASELTAGAEVLPYGVAVLSICNDGSQRTISLPDGSAAPQPTTLVFTLDAEVRYDTELSAWKVRSFSGGGEPC